MLAFVEDRRLVRLTKICDTLPEATREYNGRHARFHVRNRTFAYFLDDHQGDGIVGLSCKVAPGWNEALVEAEPDRFCKPAYLAHRGWIGLRLDRGKVDWSEVADLVTESYVLTAPKRLAAAVADAAG
jgi:predicted DNA-binding protein (MmcQ/YjbR family)